LGATTPNLYFGGFSVPLVQVFGSNLRHHRKAKSLTQEVLAESVGVSTEMISKIERGIAAPSFQTIEKIADVLGVPEVVFFGIGIVVSADDERSKLLLKVQTALSRMNNDKLSRAHRMLSALID
jgi:transcriptional regulator with XRE-family HTH domain